MKTLCKTLAAITLLSLAPLFHGCNTYTVTKKEIEPERIFWAPGEEKIYFDGKIRTLFKAKRYYDDKDYVITATNNVTNMTTKFYLKKKQFDKIEKGEKFTYTGDNAQTKDYVVEYRRRRRR